MKTVHIKVHGRVHGVYFRQSTQEQAEALQISGWVRNMPDGTVEMMVTGDDKSIDQLTRWCHQGPRKAVVNKVEVTDAPLNKFTSFEIQRF